MQVRADATQLALVLLCAYTVICHATDIRGTPTLLVRVYAGNERVIFSACSSHEWAPRRVGFTDTSATPLRSDVLLLLIIDFADAWRHRRSVIAAGR